MCYVVRCYPETGKSCEDVPKLSLVRAQVVHSHDPSASAGNTAPTNGLEDEPPRILQQRCPASICLSCPDLGMSSPIFSITSFFVWIWLYKAHGTGMEKVASEATHVFGAIHRTPLGSRAGFRGFLISLTANKMGP